MKRIITLLTAGLAVLLLAACTTSSQSSSGQSGDKAALSSKPKISGITYYGDVPESPKRLVNLASSYTGYLLKLEQPLVGVTHWDKENPIISDRLTDAKEVDPANLEAISSLEPDLIVVGSTEENIEELAEIAPLIVIEYGKRDYLQVHTDFGRIFNQEKEAQQWVDDWKEQAAEAAKELKAVTGEDATFTIMGLYNKEITLFGNNWGRGGDVLYKALGYQAPKKVQDEVFKDGWLTISQEAVPDYVGDYIVVVASDEETGAFLYESDVWKNLPAVQQNRIIKADAEAFYYNDPLTLEYELKVLREGILAAA